MELSDNQIEILKIIHDSENHGINESEIPRLKIDFPNLDNDIEHLIENDLVEYEKRENKYYLTYEGFERLEYKPKGIKSKSDIEQYQEIIESVGSKKIILHKNNNKPFDNYNCCNNFSVY